MEQTNKINEAISHMKDKSGISDGSHTFGDLYHHRAILFAVVCNCYKNNSWKSWKHKDGTMFEDYFIVGVDTPKGQYSYHYHKDLWELFNVKELSTSPEYDGHLPEDVTRLMSLPDNLSYMFNYAMSVSFFMGNIDDLLEDLHLGEEITERQISNIERKLKVVREHEVKIKEILGVEEN